MNHLDAQQRQMQALQEVRLALRSLPGRVQEKARNVIVSVRRRPGRNLVAEGIEPDTLGLFVGDAWQDSEDSLTPLPPQIILFVDNLWEYAGQEETEFRREVRRTYLHELGHFLGLDEGELEDRGLD
jgi:predicted Zn-dependent protease with MMP-like domain